LKNVLIFGAFDGLHPGHLDFFKQAKKYGDKLIVSVGTDLNVFKIKGKKPLFNQEERLSLVKDCRIVDEAVLGSESYFYENMKKHKPDVICLGYDQWATEREALEGLKGVGLKNTRVVRLKPYQEDRAKSSITKRKSVDF